MRSRLTSAPQTFFFFFFSTLGTAASNARVHSACGCRDARRGADLLDAAVAHHDHVAGNAFDDTDFAR